MPTPFPLQEAPSSPAITPPPAGKDILRFIAEPFRAAQGNTVKNCEFFAIASDSCTDRASKKEELFYVRTMVDSMMVTNFFSCQPLPSGTAQGIATALKQ